MSYKIRTRLFLRNVLIFDCRAYFLEYRLINLGFALFVCLLSFVLHIDFFITWLAHETIVYYHVIQEMFS